MNLFDIDNKRNVPVLLKGYSYKSNYVYDANYTTAYTTLLYHWISDGGNSLLKLRKVPIATIYPLEMYGKNAGKLS